MGVGYWKAGYTRSSLGTPEPMTAMTFVSQSLHPRGQEEQEPLGMQITTVCLSHRVSILCRQSLVALGFCEKPGKDEPSPFPVEISKWYPGSTPWSW